MSQTAGQDGRGFGGGFPPSPLPPSSFPIPSHRPDPGPQNNTISVTSCITISSVTTSTLSTIFTSTLPVTVVPTASLAAQNSALKSTAALSRTNTIIAGALGGFIILLILALAIVLLLWIRRRRRGREDDSPPFTSLAPNPPTQFLPVTTQSAPQLPRQIHATSLSMGPRSPEFGGAPRSSNLHPPNRSSFSNTTTAPALSPGSPSLPAGPLMLPAINIQPNTPSVLGRDDSGPISPILQPSTARMPLYHEALQEEAVETRNRAEAENAGRLGLPVIRREGRQRSSVSASVSSIGSDIGFEENGTREHSREREGGNERVQHSTRASSGVFPDQ